MTFYPLKRESDKLLEKFCLLAAPTNTSREEVKYSRKQDLQLEKSTIWQGKNVSLSDDDIWGDELEENILFSTFYMENLANCCSTSSQILNLINPRIVILEREEEKPAQRIMNLFKVVGLSCVNDFKEQGINDKDSLEAYFSSNRNVLTMLILQNLPTYITENNWGSLPSIQFPGSVSGL